MPRHPEEHAALVRLANLGRREVPSRPRGEGPPRPPRRLEVFGTGPDWVQLTWSGLGPGPVEVHCADHRATIDADGGPGAHLVTGLAPGTEQRLELAGPGLPGGCTLRTRTLERPPGEELARIATVSDVHLGSHSTGYFHTIVEIPDPPVGHTVRCFRAALDELTDWGAEHLVVKGDLVHRSEQVNFDLARGALDGFSLPVEVVPGNHERSTRRDVDPTDALAGLGIDLVHGVHHVDRAGVRILMADTTRPHSDLGTLREVAGDLVQAAGDADGPVLVALHHQPMRFRFAVYLPPGLPGPQVRPFLRDLGRANHRVLVTSGHTHRHRRHRIEGVTATEVGSTKDFPGTWAGYHVHEGGIVQVVQRIAEPSCIRWTDHTRRAAARVWSRWAPGRLEDRCFTLRW